MAQLGDAPNHVSCLLSGAVAGHPDELLAFEGGGVNVLPVDLGIDLVQFQPLDQIQCVAINHCIILGHVLVAEAVADTGWNLVARQDHLATLILLTGVLMAHDHLPAGADQGIDLVLVQVQAVVSMFSEWAEDIAVEEEESATGFGRDGFIDLDVEQVLVQHMGD